MASSMSELITYLFISESFSGSSNTNNPEAVVSNICMIRCDPLVVLYVNKMSRKVA